ncbi:MAG: nucleoside-diphosphate-sugar pyrophosphorylase [Anaerolineaceae bacterium]|nr:nucleoside-diphosphate-sugar pyrophosphorylase [Anaerolineaceae bacterium]
MKAIILAGGRGTRLYPYTQILPKPLMPINDMPILEVIIRQLKNNGIEEIILTVGHLSELLKAFFGDGSQFGVNIQYSYEKEPLGTAGPLGLIKNLDDTFLVLNGDVLTDLSLRNLIDFHKKEKAVATIAMHKRSEKIDLGVVLCDSGPTVVGYIEKPTYDYQVSMGIYVFEPALIKYIEPGRYLDFPNLVHKLLGEGEKVTGYLFDGYWQDLGRKDDYERATKDFVNNRERFFKEIN